MNLRSRLSTLIAVRVVVSTLLLGSAILVQINRPGTFPSRSVLLPHRPDLRAERALPGIAQVRRALPLDGRRAARRRRDPGLRLHPRHRRHHELFLVAVPAADHGGEHGAVPPRRAAGGGAQRGPVSRACLGAVSRADRIFSRVVAGARPARSCRRRASRSTRWPSICSGSSPWLCCPGRSPRTCVPAGARLERASTQIADLRAFNQYVIDSMLSGLVTADMDGRILTFNRAAATITGLTHGAGDRPRRRRGAPAARAASRPAVRRSARRAANGPISSTAGRTDGCWRSA